jgi:hypothetical protein
LKGTHLPWKALRLLANQRTRWIHYEYGALRPLALNLRTGMFDHSQHHLCFASHRKTIFFKKANIFEE